jgi:hypothetical protein
MVHRVAAQYGRGPRLDVSAEPGWSQARWGSRCCSRFRLHSGRSCAGGCIRRGVTRWPDSSLPRPSLLSPAGKSFDSVHCRRTRSLTVVGPSALPGPKPVFRPDLVDRSTLAKRSRNGNGGTQQTRQKESRHVRNRSTRAGNTHPGPNRQRRILGSRPARSRTRGTRQGGVHGPPRRQNRRPDRLRD